MIQIYNSLTKKKEAFSPINPGKISLYVCGMTVYDYCHIGHARVMVAFDVIARYFRERGYEVNYVRNITDIDDKILKRAQENQEDYLTLVDRFISAMNEDFKRLGIEAPNEEPRATQHIAQIIQLIDELIAKNAAYVASNGDVYYDVSQFSEYGRLAHKDLEGQEAGARVELETAKRSPLDFVLWKLAKPDEPSWESPWGLGRPGWHIECSAMSMDCLGNHFDIHGGGIDLKFPHHENEIAQSKGAGHEFVNTWMHVGHVQVNQEKMSKSLGNFFTIRDVLNNYPAEVVRYFLLASHYRSPVNYSEENLQQAQAALERFYLALRDIETTTPPKSHPLEQQFFAAMDDDFNTPEALAVLFNLVKEINKAKDSKVAGQLAALLKKLAASLGILEHSPTDFLQRTPATLTAAEIEQLIGERDAARSNKEWEKADAIREQLSAAGIVLEDVAGKTTWRQS